MRTCPKCGSYIPEGKLVCQACGRVCANKHTSDRDRLKPDQRSTEKRMRLGEPEGKRKAWSAPEREDAPRTVRGKQSYSTYHDCSTHADENGFGNRYSEGQQRLICAMAYFGLFFVLPLALLPNSRAARFHANQGLLLLLVNILAEVAKAFLGIGVMELFTVVTVWLMIYGFVNALKGNMTELPVIGKIRLIPEERTKP